MENYVNENNEDLMNQEEENVLTETGMENVEEGELYVKFRKPFQWEDDTYKGIDLSGLEDLTAKDLGDIEKQFYRQNITSFNPENTATYARIVAQKATGMPVEFFEQLPLRYMLEIKKVVVNFLFA